MSEKYKPIMGQQPCLCHHSSKARSSGFGWSSNNWSGYTVTGKQGAFHCISGEWIVPYVKPTSKPTYSSAWIGIDGFKNSNLIQTGTGHEYVNGRAYYYAWWEIFPAYETVIPLPVRPGDHMKASIKKISRTKWLIKLRNLSQKWTFRTPQRYSGPQTSGQWIMEAPQIDGKIANLARSSLTRFTYCRINAKSPNLALVMGGILLQNNLVVAIPSCPGPSRDSFTVKRRYPKRPSTVRRKCSSPCNKS